MPLDMDRPSDSDKGYDEKLSQLEHKIHKTHKMVKHLHEDYEKHEEEERHMQPNDINLVGIPGMGGNNSDGGLFGGGGMLGGLLIGALLGRNGGGGLFGGGNEAGGAVAVDAILQNQQFSQLTNGQTSIISAINDDTRDNLLATCNLGDRMSTMICEGNADINNNIFAVSSQAAAQFAATQLQAANNTYDLSRQLGEQNFAIAQQFAASQLQACQDLNALQAQISACCCETQKAIAGVTAAAVKDELDELRLEKALAAANGSNGQVINQIAVSLGNITQVLAALQAKA